MFRHILFYTKNSSFIFMDFSFVFMDLHLIFMELDFISLELNHILDLKSILNLNFFIYFIFVDFNFFIIKQIILFKIL